MSKAKRKKVRAWLCRDMQTTYGLYVGPRGNLRVDTDGVWIDNPRHGRWLLNQWGDFEFNVRVLRHYFGYVGPLPRPGECLNVQVEEPTP